MKGVRGMSHINFFTQVNEIPTNLAYIFYCLKSLYVGCVWSIYLKSATVKQLKVSQEVSVV